MEVLQKRPKQNRMTWFRGAVIATANENIPRSYRKKYIPRCDSESDNLFHEYQESGNTEIAEELLTRLDHKQCWIVTVQNINFKHSILKAWSLLKKLGTTPNKIASNIIQGTIWQGTDPQHKQTFQLTEIGK